MSQPIYSGDIVLESQHHQKRFSFDCSYIPAGSPKPLILFVHGFKGFKDWGYFNLLAKYFADKGYIFVKMNFSHNGTTVEKPQEFNDLEAFGNNNFEIELDDIDTVLNHLLSGASNIPSIEFNKEAIYLMGHSRGGSTAILKSAEDSRIKKVITLAAISDLEKRYSNEIIQEWEKNGVIYEYNSRTQQQMPLYFQLYESVKRNPTRFSVPLATQRLTVPHLIIHGDNDTTVPVEMGKQLHQLSPLSTFHIIKNGDHTFGGTHPYTHDKLSEHMMEACELIINFLQKI